MDQIFKFQDFYVNVENISIFIKVKKVLGRFQKIQKNNPMILIY